MKKQNITKKSPTKRSGTGGEDQLQNLRINFSFIVRMIAVNGHVLGYDAV